MADRRAKGLCFNCDEKFEIGHNCKQLLWLEVIENEEVDPQISLHAIARTQNHQTMQFRGWISNAPASNSNRGKANLRVTMANGDKLSSPMQAAS
ncbi:conserved hypothetical protein, partial [Ricinus communis]